MPDWCNRPAAPERSAKGSEPGPSRSGSRHNRRDAPVAKLEAQAKCSSKTVSSSACFACNVGVILVRTDSATVLTELAPMRRRRRGLGPDHRGGSRLLTAVAQVPIDRSRGRIPVSATGFPRGGLRRGSACARAAQGRGEIRARPADVGRSGRASSSARRNSSRSIKPLASHVHWLSISVRGSAAMRWLWPRGPTFWPLTSIRACAVGSHYNAGVYNVADRVLPVRARAETFAIPEMPGFILTRTAGPSGRIVPGRSTTTSLARLSGIRFLGGSPPGRSSSARPATFPGISRVRNTRSS